MSASEPWWMLAGYFMLARIPLLLIYVIGAWLAVSRMRRQRKAMSFALTGFLILIFESFAEPVATAVAITTARQDANAPLTVLANAAGYLAVVAHCVGLALVVAAVFIGRKPVPATTDDAD